MSPDACIEATANLPFAVVSRAPRTVWGSSYPHDLGNPREAEQSTFSTSEIFLRWVKSFPKMSLVNVDLNKSGAGLSNVPASRPGLACERCKRRKIRCDRALPACRICVKMTRSCTYPSVSQKPGPKPGAPQRRKLRKLNVTSTSSLSHPDFTETSNSGAGDTGNISATGSGQNRLGSITHYQDGSAEKEDHQQNSHSTARHLEPPISPVTGQERSPPRGLTLSQLLHPSHEPMLQDSAKMNDEDMGDGRDLSRKIGNACKSLGITMQTYLWL